MSAPVDMTAVKAMLFDALTEACIHGRVKSLDRYGWITFRGVPMPKVEPPAVILAWDSSARVDADKLATTVAAWFSAREAGE